MNIFSTKFRVIGLVCLLFCVNFLFLNNVFSQTGSLADADVLLKDSGRGTGIGEGSGLSDLASVIGSALQFILSLLGTIMFGYMVYAGYLWMTAQGDEGKIETAKNMMVNTVIGFLVVVSAFAITYVVQSRFQ